MTRCSKTPIPHNADLSRDKRCRSKCTFWLLCLPIIPLPPCSRLPTARYYRWLLQWTILPKLPATPALRRSSQTRLIHNYLGNGCVANTAWNKQRSAGNNGVFGREKQHHLPHYKMEWDKTSLNMLAGVIASLKNITMCCDIWIQAPVGRFSSC